MEIILRESQSGVLIFDITGEINLESTSLIKKHIKEATNRGKNDIIVNLKKVTYVDSSGIGALISIFTQLKKKGGSLKIINMYTAVRKVFELTRLTDFFEIYENEDEALSSYG